MTAIDHAWWKWAFDGWGAALIGAIASGIIAFIVAQRLAACESGHSGDDVISAADTESVSAYSPHSQTLGTGASVVNSPHISGSGNTVNIHPQPDNPARGNDPFEGLRIVGILLIFIGIFGFVFRTALHDEDSSTKSAASDSGNVSHSIAPSDSGNVSHSIAARPVETPNPAKFGIEVAFGPDMPEDDFGVIERYSCITKGVTCMGESSLAGKVIHIPLQQGRDWARVVIVATLYNTETIENSRVVVSTSSRDVGLNYPNHRGGSLNSKVEFDARYFEATSYTGKLNSYSVDIVLAQTTIDFPLSVTVSGDGVPSHTVTMRFHLDSTVEPQKLSSGLPSASPEP
jgi:hypothetical protein